MTMCERQLLARYHRADLLREGREARLAAAARPVATTRVVLTAPHRSLGSIVATAIGRLHRGAARPSAVEPSVAGHIVLRSAHPR